MNAIPPRLRERFEYDPLFQALVNQLVALHAATGHALPIISPSDIADAALVVDAVVRAEAIRRLGPRVIDALASSLGMRYVNDPMP